MVQLICKGRKEALGPLGPWGSFDGPLGGPLKFFLNGELYLHVLLGAVGLGSATITKCTKAVLKQRMSKCEIQTFLASIFKLKNCHLWRICVTIIPVLAFYKGQITHDVNVCYKSGMMRKGQWFVKQTPIRPVIQNSSHIEHRILCFPVNPVLTDLTSTPTHLSVQVCRTITILPNLQLFTDAPFWRTPGLIIHRE